MKKLITLFILMAFVMVPNFSGLVASTSQAQEPSHSAVEKNRARISLVASPSSGRAPFNVNLTAKISNTSMCTGYTFDYGNGLEEYIDRACSAGSNAPVATRLISRTVTYQTPGTYTARITSTSGLSESLTIRVAAR